MQVQSDKSVCVCVVCMCCMAHLVSSTNVIFFTIHMYTGSNLRRLFIQCQQYCTCFAVESFCFVVEGIWWICGLSMRIKMNLMVPCMCVCVCVSKCVRFDVISYYDNIVKPQNEFIPFSANRLFHYWCHSIARNIIRDCDAKQNYSHNATTQWEEIAQTFRQTAIDEYIPNINITEQNTTNFVPQNAYVWLSIV